MIFKLIHAIRHTRAITLIKGLAVVVVAGVVAQAFGLRTVNWLLDQATTTVFVALPIVLSGIKACFGTTRQGIVWQSGCH